jgi:hypothetical protein
MKNLYKILTVLLFTYWSNSQAQCFQGYYPVDSNASFNVSSDPSAMLLVPFTSTASGTFNNIGFLKTKTYSNPSNNTLVRLYVYSSNNGDPGSLLGSSIPQLLLLSDENNKEKTYNFSLQSAITLAPGTNYFIGILTQGGLMDFVACDLNQQRPLKKNVGADFNTGMLTPNNQNLPNLPTPVVFLSNIAIPTAANPQNFATAATVSNLVASGGTTLKWYSSHTSGTQLASTTSLTNNTYYYVSANNGGSCDSPRVPVLVTVPSAPDVLYTGLSSNYCLNVAIGNITPVNTGGTVTTYSINPALPLGLSLNTTTGIISGTPTVAAATTTYTVTATNTIGTSTPTFSFAVNATPAAPIATSPQNLFTGNTVANLTPSGNNIKWYDGSTASFPLPTNTTLVNNTVYYVSQLINGCEGPRTAVTVTVMDQIPNISYSVPSVGICIGKAVSFSPSNTGGAVSPLIGIGIKYAGGGTQGTTDGTLATALLYTPADITQVTSTGDFYFTEKSSNVIRKISSTGNITTYAGTLNSFGDVNSTILTAAKFGDIQQIVAYNSILYVVDNFYSKVKKVTSSGVTTFLSINKPRAIAVDATGNVYVGTDDHVIYKVTSAGVATLLAGQSGTSGTADGTGATARFNGPYGLAVDASNNVYVADYYNHSIRKITPAGVVTTLAGLNGAAIADINGTAANARFSVVTDVAVNVAGDVFVCDYTNLKIKRISNGNVSTYTTFLSASGNSEFPDGMCITNSGDMYVAFASRYTIKKVNLYKYAITPAISNGLSFDNNTGIISGTPIAAAANVDYTVSGANGGGTDTTTVGITVVDSPGTPGSVNIDFFSYCAGNPNILSNINSYFFFTGGSTNNWSPKTYNSNTATTELTSITTSGVYHVAFVNAAGCESARRSIYVTVNDLSAAPTATSTQILCSGSRVSDLIATGTNIKWYPNATSTTNLSSSDLLTNNTVYYATQSNPCESSSRTAVTTTLKPNPTPAQLAITRSGDVLTIAQAGATYQWYKIVSSVGVLISGATNQSYTAIAADSYYAEVTINGCLAETDSFTIITLGINDFDFNSKLLIYPNPSNAIFNIDIDSNATIEVFDLVGKQILTKKIELGTTQLDMTNYNTGMYLLKVTNTDNQTKTMKIVKQ